MIDPLERFNAGLMVLDIILFTGIVALLVIGEVYHLIAIVAPLWIYSGACGL